MFKKIISLAFSLLLVVPFASAQTIATALKTTARHELPLAQKTVPTATPSQEPEDDVVRITSKLVQLDLVVTDKKGVQVTDLKPEDFEIFEDDHPQPITHFSYIFTGPSTDSANAQTSVSTSAISSGPPRRERVRRTIAVVVDDLGMSYVTTRDARVALTKFINEQIQPDDLVAIIRTGSGIGALQQFTHDKRQLLAAVERVRWNFCSRSGITVVQAEGDSRTPPICSIDTVRVSVEALRSIVSGMRELPGRKSLILFGDGFPVEVKEDRTKPMFSGVSLPADDGSFRRPTNTTLTPLQGGNRQLLVDPSRVISEAAIRASVVVYSVDTRGLGVLSLSAADNVGNSSLAKIRDLESDRIALNQVGRPESGMVTDATGGLFIQNTNDLNLGLKRIMDDQRGYYLIGYRPGSDTFDRRFHKISARVVNRSDLIVRTRSGFYGVTEDQARPATLTAVDRFQRALVSPFAANDINVRLTPVFTSTATTGPVLRSMLHISARDLTFKEEPDGWRTAQLVLRGVLFGDNGQIIDEHRRAFTVRLRGATFERVQTQGFDYVFNMPAKKPGGYQFRVAIIEESSARVGSAGQYVEVPDLKKKRLALSGILLSEAGPANEGTTYSAVDATEGPLQAQAPETNSGARRFRRNTAINYDYLVFNGSGDPTSGRMTALVHLYRAGKLVLEHNAPVDIVQQTDASRLLVGGRLKLGTDLGPGEYVLEITVKDPLAKKGQEMATQLTDFEIVE
jgi:VWFA-related protein